MKEIDRVVTFRTGAAASGSMICLSAAIDAFDPDEPYSDVYFLNLRDDPDQWAYRDFDFLIPSICVWRDPVYPTKEIFVALSENGEVALLSLPIVLEQIPEAGLTHESAKGYGYLNDIQQIGNHLYACGFSGQVYKREQAGRWRHMDSGILQSPDLDEGEYAAAVINGAREDAIYVAGCEYVENLPARADYWDGRTWARLVLPPTAGRITDIFVESEQKIWMCGDHGTVLVGSAQSGFATVNRLGSAHCFYSITKFRDRYYLGSSDGLFQFDLSKPNPVFRKVRTNLMPELTDANVVQSVGDMLWSIGPKDIARFDGARWERFDHPDNPPVGAGHPAVP